MVDQWLSLILGPGRPEVAAHSVLCGHPSWFLLRILVIRHCQFGLCRTYSGRSWSGGSVGWVSGLHCAVEHSLIPRSLTLMGKN